MYRTIAASFWTDPKVKKLNPTSKLLLLYLITNPHTHVSGIYVLNLNVAVIDSGLNLNTLSRSLDTLSSAGFCAFDPAKDVIWVKKMMAYQGKGEKNQRSAAAHVAEDLHNSFLCKEFLDSYPEVRQFVKPSFIDTLSDRVLDTVSETRTPDSRSRSRSRSRLQILNTDTETDSAVGTAAQPPFLNFGEFQQVRITEHQYEKLKQKLNSHLDAYINRLDRYSQTNPKAFREYKSHYATILTWHDRDLKEGKSNVAVNPSLSNKPSNEEMDRIGREMFPHHYKAKS